MASFLRLLAAIALIGILSLQLYNEPPSWWWMVKPLFVGAWSTVTSLSYETQLKLVGIAWAVMFLIAFMRRWWVHILLAIAVLTLLPGMTFALAVQVLLYVVPAILITRVIFVIHRWWTR